jgi:hypothetical protein
MDIMFTDKEMDLLKEFYFWCFNERVEKEEQSGMGTKTWRVSYWVYDLMENLTLGEEEYSKVRLPIWLNYMPKYRVQTAMLQYGRKKRLMFEEMKKAKTLPSNLLVCEVAYGVDIVLAMMIKKWGKIMCYDHNSAYGDFLKSFFVNRHNLNLTFVGTSSSDYRFDEIQEDTLVISNNTHIAVGEPSERIRNNKNLLYLRDGVFVPQDSMPLTTEECRERFGRGYL